MDHTNRSLLFASYPLWGTLPMNFCNSIQRAITYFPTVHHGSILNIIIWI